MSNTKRLLESGKRSNSSHTRNFQDHEWISHQKLWRPEDSGPIYSKKQKQTKKKVNQESRSGKTFFQKLEKLDIFRETKVEKLCSH